MRKEKGYEHQLLRSNEQESNTLSLKVMCGIIGVGFGFLGILSIAEIVAITFHQWLVMFLFSLSIVGLEVVLWRFFNERGFVKYGLVFFNCIIFFFLFYINEINLAMSPFWILPLALSVLYMHLPLSLLAGLCVSLGNAYFVFTDPGRGMELVDISAKATNSLVFLITVSSLVFIAFKGRRLLGRISLYEQEATERAETLKDIILSSREMAEKTNLLSVSLNTVAAQLNSSFEEITAATLEASQGAEDLSHKSSLLSSFSENVSRDARQSQEALQEIVGQMGRIQESIGKYSSSFTVLKDRMIQMEEILISIEGIAGETNMLALNAAIEAARAGEHGIQFSVVAEEVRALAGEASSASNNMNTIVHEIRDHVEGTFNTVITTTEDIQGGIRGIKRAQEEIGKVLPAAEKSHQELIKVTAAIQDFSSTIQNIASASQEQTAAVEEIHASVELLKEQSDQILSRLLQLDE